MSPINFITLSYTITAPIVQIAFSNKMIMHVGQIYMSCLYKVKKELIYSEMFFASKPITGFQKNLWSLYSTDWFQMRGLSYVK